MFFMFSNWILWEKQKSSNKYAYQGITCQNSFIHLLKLLLGLLLPLLLPLLPIKLRIAATADDAFQH